MKNPSNHSVLKKLTSFVVSLCLAAAFVPCVSASSVSDSDMPASASSVSGSDLTTTAAPVSGSDLTDSTKSYTQTSDVQQNNRGFENVETDGGVVFVGTARVPKEDGSIGVVKFVYSSSLNLNDKSLALINKEVAACGVSIPDGMIYVSRSDIVSDSQLMNQTSERQAVFAVGTPSNPTLLKACPAYSSVEESFERLYRGYIFSITGYSSLKSLLDGRDEVTLSDDGQTASTSIVMSEDYVEKVINGRKIKILMINSELKYYFRAPKLTFVKDQDYNVSDSDIVYHYPTRSTTDPSDTLTTVDTDATKIGTEPFFDDYDPTFATTDPTEPTKDGTSSTEPVQSDEPTSSDDSDTTTGTFWDDDSTMASLPTQPTNPTTESDDDWWNTTDTTGTTQPTQPTDPTKLYPYAHPIDPIPTQSTTEEVPTAPPTQPTTELPTESTTEPTQKPTKSLTWPTATQPTRQDPIIDPFNQYEQKTGGPAYIKTRRLPLNIRTGPGLNYRVIKVMPKGTRLTVLDASNPDWYMVRLRDGTVGYAFSYYIRFL